ncbi:MAG: restriction endonuclease subunit S [Candidatus Aegiribacteria sp.]|nr:restriction endonuclease subunit S [Candidatus Aegiribacteria sp.]
MTKVGWIPDDWLYVTLGEFTKWSSGGTPSKANDDYWNGDIPWISAVSMRGTRYHDSVRKITATGLQTGSRIAPKNSILLLVRGSMLHKKIPVGIAARDVAFNQDVKSIVPEGNTASTEYLLCWFLGNERRLMAMVGGTGIGAGKLDYDELRSLPIPLPPLLEQEAIAGVLECWDRAIHKYEEKLEKKKNIKKGLMQRLLSGKQRLPGFSGEWKSLAFGNVFSFMKTYPFSRDQLTTETTNNTIIYNIHYGDLHATYSGCTLDCAKEKSLPRLRNSSDIPDDSVLLQDGDLVIADVSEDYEGVCACIELKNVCGKKITGGLHTFAARDSEGKTASGYIGYILKDRSVTKELMRIATGVSVYGVSKRNLARVRIHLPSVMEQRAIALVLSAADEEISALERKLAFLKEQKRFLLNNLVTGTIRLPEFNAGNNTYRMRFTNNEVDN